MVAWLVALYMGLAVSQAVLAEDGQQVTAEMIESSVRHHLDTMAESQTELEFELPELDPRRRFMPCPMPLKVSTSVRELRPGPMTLRVGCDGEKPWLIHLRVNVHLYRTVLVMAHTLPRGAILTDDALLAEKRDVSHLNGRYMSDRAYAVGKVLKVALAAGTLLHHEQLLPPKMIHKGDEVSIRTAHPLIDVGVPGVALADGEEGQQISVRNTRSGQVVRGRVAGPGVVEVAF
ncbi:MAG: flagellar basal body P-ring biosynthesis protein FlgA [Pseudomonadota bacterium]